MNPKLERLLAGVGIVVAIGIVAVLIVVVMKLFGGFSHAGLGSLHTTVASNEAEMETSTGEGAGTKRHRSLHAGCQRTYRGRGADETQGKFPDDEGFLHLLG